MNVTDASRRGADLEALRSPGGAISMPAIDHRDAMTNAFARAGRPDVTAEQILDFKLAVIRALAPHCSGFLVDAVPLSADRAAVADRGVAMPLEAQGHISRGGGRLNSLEPGFSPEVAAEFGAVACKLLLYYRADHATATAQLRLVEEAAKLCHRQGLALIPEPLVYRLEDEDEGAFRQRYGELVVRAAEDLAATEADMLKVQFPAGDDPAGACRQITSVLHGRPWVLLGGSEVSPSEFERQLATAVTAGAAGFLAGRVLWGPLLLVGVDDYTAVLNREVVPLLKRLNAIAEGRGKAERA